MNRGVFRCGECSTYFPEAVPPMWIEYWPSHCGERAFLQFTLGSVAVETKVAETLMVGARSSAPTALLEPLPSAWANWDEEERPTPPAHHGQLRKNRMRELELLIAVAVCKALPFTLLVPGVLLT